MVSNTEYNHRKECIDMSDTIITDGTARFAIRHKGGGID